MKKTRAFTGLVMLLALALACFAPLAMAAEIYIIDPIHVSGNGTVWYVDTTNVDGLYSFDADEIASVEAAWIGADGSYNVLVPKHEVINNNKVQVQFDPADLPSGDNAAAATGIILTLTNGDTVIYSGPGFAWGRR